MTVLGIANRELFEGDDETRRRAREDLRRQQRLRLAESSNWKRIDLADLEFKRFLVTNARTGETLRIYRGEVLDAMHSPIVAWAIGRDGPIFFERSR